jgi:hypothetical protein
MVEEWRPRFETMGHCGAIDLGEETTAEIELEIHQLIRHEVRFILARPADSSKHAFEGLEMSAWIFGGNGAPQLRGEQGQGLTRGCGSEPFQVAIEGWNPPHAQEALQQVRRTDVGVGRLEAVRQRARGVSQPLRNPVREAREPVPHIRWISREQLVPSFAGEHNTHVPGSKPREYPCREQARISERLIHALGDPMEQSLDTPVVDLQFMVLGPNAERDVTGEWRFVISTSRDAKAECRESTAASRGQRGD